MTVIDSPALSNVQSALASCRQQELRRLSVVETEDRIEVYGRVSTFYLKSVALETVKSAADGRAVQIHIEVES